ncbi:flagellar export protein FliJ [Eubacterium oxidoreducens]|uniref:Flagellar FliJ protein n=1 Tax=Eubacterium oxidoreducens TaxID=1732 RepID=A0A1G6AQ39_EUBOX|nr:flagellar export protein FliJ [Eubacterium oxidoreducens]SDB10530.1 flagellar FliJ protein [Eubacterium oxidoreducens]
MAKFTYKLQNILDIKYKLENQAKSEFSMANATLLREEEKLKALTTRKKLYEMQGKNLVKDKIDIVAIKENKNAVSAMMYAIEQQKIQIKRAQDMVEQARRKLNDVMMERKTHEKLKEKEFEEFKQEINYEENKSIDESVSYTFGKKTKS